MPIESQGIDSYYPAPQPFNQAGPSFLQDSWNNYSNPFNGYPQPMSSRGASYGQPNFRMHPPNQQTPSQSFPKPEGSFNDPTRNPLRQNQTNLAFYSNGLGPYTVSIPAVWCGAPNTNQSELFDLYHQSMDRMSSQLEPLLPEQSHSSISQTDLQQNELQVNTSTVKI
ncbi:hypothetical protein L5515_016727 [Caenorhabditis briggsae]|uniref:Uncharacterized protein n=1 Tax=Caenorhabditis briggsae TaxID=6238 RepID=A0AAE9JQB8_CAEBR|nr:hypothetical protein L5515_016727 [Caenorhabditis briggsae]